MDLISIMKPPKLDFNDIAVANLGLEGTANLKGTTKGNGHSAVFGFNIDADNFGFKTSELAK